MADGKEYISRPDELGSIHISEEVLAVIAAAAALEIDGVASLSANLGSDLAGLLGRKNLAKGVRIGLDEAGKVCVDLSILIRYGSQIPEVARAVQNAVYTTIESASGLEVAHVNIRVGGVAFERGPRRPEHP